MLLAARILKLRVPIPRLVFTLEDRRFVVCVASHHELAGAVEVFRSGYYDHMGRATPRRVLDLGANVGFASILFAARYPDAEIIAVEPSPDTFRRLCANVQELDSVVPIEAAIGTKSGTTSIDLAAPSTERNTLGLAPDAVPVRQISLAEVLESYRWDQIDLLKIDIEGAEFGILRDPAMRHVDTIVGEIHPEHAPLGYTDLDSWLPFHSVVEQIPVGDSAVMFRARRDSELVTA